MLPMNSENLKVIPLEMNIFGPPLVGGCFGVWTGPEYVLVKGRVLTLVSVSPEV